MGIKLSTVLPATAAVEITDEVKSDLETLWKYLRENPAERGFGEFDTNAEKRSFIRQAKAWADSEDLRFRVVKGGSDTEVTFILAPPLTEEQRAANKARQEARKAKEAATANSK